MVQEIKDTVVEIKAITISPMKKEVKAEPEEMIEEIKEIVKDLRISITEIEVKSNNNNHKQRRKKKIRSQNFLKNGKKLGSKESNLRSKEVKQRLRSQKDMIEDHKAEIDIKEKAIIIERKRRLKKKFK